MLLVVVLVCPADAWKTVHEKRLRRAGERRKTVGSLPFRSKGEGKDKPIGRAIQNKNLGGEMGPKTLFFLLKTSFLTFFRPFLTNVGPRLSQGF